LIKVKVFFNEINPFRICEIPFGREILLRNMKYALRRVDLFHFTESGSFQFYNFGRNYFTFAVRQTFHSNFFQNKKTEVVNATAPIKKNGYVCISLGHVYYITNSVLINFILKEGVSIYYRHAFFVLRSVPFLYARKG